jgi:DNA-directed RNA polymerase subunit RPC12/RpoP
MNVADNPIYGLMSKARSYTCEGCGNENLISTNHTAAVLHRCPNCSWKTAPNLKAPDNFPKNRAHVYCGGALTAGDYNPMHWPHVRCNYLVIEKLNDTHYAVFGSGNPTERNVDYTVELLNQDLADQTIGHARCGESEKEHHTIDMVSMNGGDYCLDARHFDNALMSKIIMTFALPQILRASIADVEAKISAKLAEKHDG